MRGRTVILILTACLIADAVIVIGVWSFTRNRTSNDAVSAAGPRPIVEATYVDSPAREPSVAPELTAVIDSPADGESVPRRFQASGRCSAVPPTHRLLLAVQTGRVFSPKMPPVTVDGENWSSAVGEFGVAAGGAFTLCLFQVPEAELAQIAQWHAQGKATGKYPPYREVPGGVLLAKVNLRVRNR